MLRDESIFLGCLLKVVCLHPQFRLLDVYSVVVPQGYAQVVTHVSLCVINVFSEATYYPQCFVGEFESCKTPRCYVTLRYLNLNWPSEVFLNNYSCLHKVMIMAF